MTTERTLDLNKMKEVHKELQSKIYGCKCNPSLEPWMYCKQCQNTVIEFMNNYGAGVLCRDIEVDTLQKELSKTKISLTSVEKKFESKCKDYENLKIKQEQTNQNIKEFYDNVMMDSWDEQFGMAENEDYCKGIQYVKELILKYAKHFPQIGNHSQEYKRSDSRADYSVSNNGLHTKQNLETGGPNENNLVTQTSEQTEKTDQTGSVSEVNNHSQCSTAKGNSRRPNAEAIDGGHEINGGSSPPIDSNTQNISEVNNQGCRYCGGEGIFTDFDEDGCLRTIPCPKCQSKQEKKQ